MSSFNIESSTCNFISPTYFTPLTVKIIVFKTPKTFKVQDIIKHF